MGAIAYASGRYAWGICQKCGLRFPYAQLRSDGHWRHLRVCGGCYDPRHPQERLLPVSDATALWRPSPEDKHAPTAPVLSGENDGTTNSLSWTAVTSQDSRVAGYRLYRDEVLIADLEIETDYTGAVQVDPRTYDDENLAVGTYEYAVFAYDLRGLVSASSNVVTLTVAAATGVSVDVTVGELTPGYPYGFEIEDFILSNPPLYGNTDPYPPVVDGSTMYAVWSHPDNGGLEMWWSLHLPTNCTTLRVHTSSGYIDLDWLNPSDSTDQPEGQSYIYWAAVQPWDAGDVGEIRRLEFLE